jgi:tricarballylate dehydrogenase
LALKGKFMTHEESPGPTVIVIGAGIAGLSAAVAAAEATPGSRVLVLDRAEPGEAGGLTRWTSAYFRLDDVYEPGDSFVSDIVDFSDGKTPTWYVQKLHDELPYAMEWIQGHGVRFRRLPTYFINSSRPRLQPVGGGEAMLHALTAAATTLGVEFRYATTASALLRDDDGRIAGVQVCDSGVTTQINADAVIIASGGFEGDETLLARELGSTQPLIPIAPGVAFNRGEGITMALDAGAARAGQWDSFHAEPVDPRSADPEPLVMVFPYGILVNRHAQRFIDEGRGTVDETYESTARTIWAQPEGTAYWITDTQFDLVEARERGILTGVKPITADTLVELAAQLDLLDVVLAETISTFNAAVTDGDFDWRTADHKSTIGIEPPKSNWALRIDQPPYLAYPIQCAIVFTFGGLATDDQARVITDTGEPIPGLYAAGECTGLYYGKYPGGTSVMRGLVFGLIAGRAAAAKGAVNRDVANQPASQ